MSWTRDEMIDREHKAKMYLHKTEMKNLNRKGELIVGSVIILAGVVMLANFFLLVF